MIVVVDASAAGNFLLPDEQGRFGDFARRICQTHTVHVPQHWPVEVANIIWKAYRRKRISDTDIQRVGDAATVLADTVLIGTELPPGRLASRAVRLGLTAYDASYLMLARTLNAPLLTGDARLHHVAGEQGMTVLTP